MGWVGSGHTKWTHRLLWLAAPAAAVDRYLLPAPRLRQQADVGRWDRQTDGRTPDRYIDPAPRTMWAALRKNVRNVGKSKKNVINVRRVLLLMTSPEDVM